MKPITYHANSNFLKLENRAREMTQQLRALGVLPEAPRGSVPSTHVMAHNHCNSSPRGLDSLF